MPELVNLKSEQLSCSLDGELDEQLIEDLVDSLLDDNEQGKQLRSQWQSFNLLSSTMSSDLVKEIPMQDRAKAISKIIESEESYSIVRQAPQQLQQLEISSIMPFLNRMKKFGVGSAIAASLTLILFNLINTEFFNQNPNQSTPNITDSFEIKYSSGESSTKIKTELSQKAYQQKNSYNEDTLRKNKTNTTMVVNKQSEPVQTVELVNDADKIVKKIKVINNDNSHKDQ